MTLEKILNKDSRLESQGRVLSISDQSGQLHIAESIYKSHFNPASVPKRPRTLDETVSFIREARMNNFSTVKIAMLLGLKKSTINFYSNSISEERRPKNKKINDADIVLLLEEGPSLQEFADIEGVERQAIQTHLVRKNIHKTWKKYRALKELEIVKHSQERLGLLQDIHSLIEGKIETLTKESSWPYKMASQYILLYTINQKRVETKKVIAVFEKYHEAEISGKPVSLEELGSYAGIKWESSVSNILKRVGLGPMIRNRPKRIASESEQESLRLSLDSNLPYGDISHFLSIPKHLVRDYHKKNRNPTSGSRKILVKHPKIKLTYRLASKVYEADDLGFRSDEISELYDANQKVVEHALKNRTSLEPVVIASLRTLFNSDKIEKPYF